MEEQLTFTRDVIMQALVASAIAQATIEANRDPEAARAAAGRLEDIQAGLETSAHMDVGISLLGTYIRVLRQQEVSLPPLH